MSIQTRREWVAALASRYQQSNKHDKHKILEEFIAATGYHPKYAIQRLNHPPALASNRVQRKRMHRYDQAVQSALVTIWEAANRICSKRLVPFLPDLIFTMERFDHLQISVQVRDHLLSISAATVDRLLQPFRTRLSGKGLSTTRAGSLFKQQIPVRTFADWDNLVPGFFEADLVAHCGRYNVGSYLNSLVLTDIASGWTECMALLMRDQELVVQALKLANDRLPIRLLGLDTDNGSEFINHTLLDYCRDQKITFTRCRPYKKNDQCYVEQKNGSIVRRLIGYDRYCGMEACRLLAELYTKLRWYINYFQPSMKLVATQRRGAKVTKQYDAAQTPCQRLLNSNRVDDSVKARLCTEYIRLDPVQLLAEIEQLRDHLWLLAQPDLEAETTETQPDIKPAQRFYRRRKHTGRPHTWRTRPDPFDDVWPMLEAELIENPETNAKTLFKQLQTVYPGKYALGQLRTLQRRVKAWRQRQAVKIMADCHPQSDLR